MTKVVQVRKNVEWTGRVVLRSQKGPHLENIQQVELRGLSDTAGVVAVFCSESTYRADEIQSDNINTLRY